LLARLNNGNFVPNKACSSAQGWNESQQSIVNDNVRASDLLALRENINIHNSTNSSNRTNKRSKVLSADGPVTSISLSSSMASSMTAINRGEEDANDNNN
jgi:hypothetical protein